CGFLPPSQHLRRERDDLHVVLGAQLARNRPEDAGADRLHLRRDQHRGVAVEADDRAVRPAHILAHPHHHGLHHVALLHAPARNRFLDRDDDDVAHGRILPLGADQHLDAHDAARAGIVRHVEIGLHLDHDAIPVLSRSRCSSAHVTFCFFSPRTTVQRLSFEIGRCSSIHTTSPTAYSFCSSWAKYFFDRRTVFLSSGWVNRRSTRTMRVFACLSLTTMPWSMRFGTSASLLRLRLGGALLPRDRPDAGDVAANLAHPRGVLELARRALKAQVEPLPLELQQLVVELVDGHVPQIVGLEHGGHFLHSAMRATKRVLIGSLAAASASASLATWIGTPSISNMMRPGFTRATHSSGAPLPEPMRTSSGFFDTGTSGKTRIHTRPARFMWRVMARRAASIWRAVTRSGSSALRPYSPNDNEAPLVARPRMRPLCALRNLVFIGCSMAVRLSQTRSPASGVAPRTAGVGLGQLLVLRHRVVLEDLALEDPHLDAAGAVGRERGGDAVVDVGAQRVQRHAAFAIPLHARDLGAAEAARTVDADALGAEPHRRLHRALHGAAEGDATLELLGDRLGDELRVEFRLADLDDVDDDVRVGELGDLPAQLLDVGALLADDDARPRRLDRHP